MAAAEDEFLVDASNRGLYAVLSLPLGAAIPEVRRAFKKLALKHHPDKAAAGDEDATALFQRLAVASGCLSDAATRDVYSAILRTRFYLAAQRPVPNEDGTLECPPFALFAARRTDRDERLLALDFVDDSLVESFKDKKAVSVPLAALSGVTVDDTAAAVSLVFDPPHTAFCGEFSLMSEEEAEELGSILTSRLKGTLRPALSDDNVPPRASLRAWCTKPQRGLFGLTRCLRFALLGSRCLLIMRSNGKLGVVGAYRLCGAPYSVLREGERVVLERLDAAPASAKNLELAFVDEATAEEWREAIANVLAGRAPTHAPSASGTLGALEAPCADHSKVDDTALQAAFEEAAKAEAYLIDELARVQGELAAATQRKEELANTLATHMDELVQQERSAAKQSRVRAASVTIASALDPDSPETEHNDATIDAALQDISMDVRQQLQSWKAEG